MTLNYPPAPRLSEIVCQLEPCLVHIRTEDGNGSGFVIDAQGCIVTNAHVVGRNNSVSVEFIDGITAAGVVLGRDEEMDLACVQVSSRTDLAAVPTGDSDAERVGEDVVVMGYPLGDMLKGTPTVTRGIISAKRNNLLQTDAAINPGSSGGPLVNIYGHVIGVNTWGIDRVGEHNVQGVGFAIPINAVRERLEFLKGGGVVNKQAEQDQEPAGARLKGAKPKGTNWVTHDIGESGFSIRLPEWWIRYEPDARGAAFHNEESVASLLLTTTHANFPLQSFAQDRRKDLFQMVQSWSRAEIGPLSAIEEFGGWAFEFAGERVEGSGTIKGIHCILLLTSPTGSVHVCYLQLETNELSFDDAFGLQELARVFLNSIELWTPYWSDVYQWRVAAAPGWLPSEYEDDDLTLWAPDNGPAYVHISIVDLAEDSPVEELCRQEVWEHLSRSNSWASYELLSAHEDDFGDHDWFRVNYRYQGQDDKESCFRIVQTGRVGSQEYTITADTFETYLPDCADHIDQMLGSFRFNSPRSLPRQGNR